MTIIRHAFFSDAKQTRKIAYFKIVAVQRQFAQSCGVAEQLDGDRIQAISGQIQLFKLGEIAERRRRQRSDPIGRQIEIAQSL